MWRLLQSEKSTMHLTLDKYAEMGAFDNTSTKGLKDENDTILADYINKCNIKEFICHAVRCKKIL